MAATSPQRNIVSQFNPNYLQNSKSDKPLKDRQAIAARASTSYKFDQPLTYVMVKGKVQPSEKYIYKNMLPYTNANKFQSMRIKTTGNNRNALILQEMLPSNTQTTSS